MLDVNKLFKGKTIKYVDTSASNVWVFNFTDCTMGNPYGLSADQVSMMYLILRFMVKGE